MKRRPPAPPARKPAAAAAQSADNAQYRRAVQCYEQGRHDEALTICKRLASHPALQGQACLLMGNILLLRQQTQAAETALQTAAQKLNSTDAWFNLGRALQAGNKLEQAEAAYRKTLQINPKLPGAWNNLGNLLQQSHDRAQLQQAIDCYQHALALRPDFVSAHTNLGIVYALTDQTEQAEQQYRKALEIEPDFSPALTALANLLKAGKPEQAQALYRKTLQVDPKQAGAWINLGNLLLDRGIREQIGQAVECYQRALALQPNDVGAQTNLGYAYTLLGQNAQAEQQYRKALEAAPNYMPALIRLADLLRIAQRYDETLALYRKAWQLEPDRTARMADFIGNRRVLADWSHDGPQPAQLIDILNNGGGLNEVSPWLLLPWPEASPALLRDTAAHFGRSSCPRELSQPPMVSQVADVRGRRIRIGYLSADFRDHAVTQLITDVIAHHDRQRFEIFLYAYGPEQEDHARQALRRAAEHFTSVAALSDRAAAEKIRTDGIDLLVELTGYTAHMRPGIAALRPAAVIASWLGYIGTLGEPRLADYIIGDAMATPPERAGDFSESLALMPHCFQPNRALAPPTNKPAPTRRAEGLPEDAFVFCSFNQCFKLTPALWDDWCRILERTGNSVLWLAPMKSPSACDNLRREAAQRGIDPQRLIFAKRLPLPEHQARVALADLALDTWPYNSGTTASDTLRAGVPLLALLGETFVGRMAASLLHCLGLDELIAQDRAAYIDLAVTLASDKTRLQAIKRTLISRLPDSPLFDPQRFARDLERLFEAMIAQRARGESGVVSLAEPRATDGNAPMPHHQLDLPLAPQPEAASSETTDTTDEAQYHLAVQYYEQGKHDAAFAICERLVTHPALQGRACLLMGMIHLQRQQAQAAEAVLQTAVQQLNSATAWFYLARAFQTGDKPDQAEAAYRKTLQIDPKLPGAWINLGGLLLSHNNREQAEQVVECYQHALALQPNNAGAYANLGYTYYTLLGQNEQAEQQYRKALEVAPNFIQALGNLADLLKNTQRLEEALPLFRKVWQLEPGHLPHLANYVMHRRLLADWSHDGPQPAELIAAIQNDDTGTEFFPGPLLTWPEASPQLLREAGARFAHARCRTELSQPPMVSQVADVHGRRIRVGYLSADLRNHPVAYLMTDVIALHDRERFEVFLYAYGPEEEDLTRQTLRQAAEHFTNVSALSNHAAAEQIRADGIDLLVDLTGYTTHMRPGIAALRPAAVIASWLGYIGTLGEPRLADYVIGDAVATPPERAGDFSESLALMPHCFQPNRTLAVTAAVPAPERRAEDLPEDAFVFCSFNQCFKLTPTLWDDWCRILERTGNSVLWLAPMKSPLACDNLRREAAQRGIDPQRLIFAKRLPLPEHQARIALADLALDTWPYNSGTTASDTLRAGVPLLTLRGETFSGRMAASLLHCLGMDELIAQDRAAYIDLAVALASDKTRLQALKAALASRLHDSPLFDPQRFARDLERLFEAMIAQRARGQSGVVSLPASHTTAEHASPPAQQPKAAATDAADEAQYRLALQRYGQGKYDEAFAICEPLTSHPALQGRACLLMGCIHLLRQQYPAAETVLQTAVQKLDSADAWFNLALALVAVGKPEQAQAAYRATLQRDPKQSKAWNNLGNLLSASRDSAQRQQEAMDCFRRALALQPNYAHALTGLGLAYKRIGQAEEAERQYRKALDAAPDYIPALTALADLLLQGNDDKRLQQVMTCCQRALALRPDSVSALTLLGLAYERTIQPAQAERQYRKALETAPDFPPALAALANLLKATKRHEEALPLLRKVWQLEPNPTQMAEFIAQRRYLADWSPDGPQPADLVAAIEHDETGAAIIPFHLLAWPEVSPGLLRDMAARYAATCWRYELSQPPLVSHVADVHGRRIRVGYLSADFHNQHPVAYLLTDMLSHHDRERFEVFLYAYGPDVEDQARQALRQAAEHFTSVSALSDRAAAERIRADGIDLLIDLTGYTANLRMGITALRPAAVIASWLGYIGTLGEPRLADYIIGDAVATPPERAGDFSESLALMPHCFQPNQALTAMADIPIPDRRAEGLPEDAFVFCSFNQCFKFTPALWDDWCRILSSADNSVLWLAPMKTATASENLRRETAQRGIDPQRLVFANRRLPLHEHQARVALADLALDTWPYNSGATASDVLRAGVPLLTLKGETFAGRMGGSLLHCLGMDELIAENRAAYVDLALALAADQARRQAIKRTLVSRLKDSPLFDPKRFVRDLERLFQAMIEQRARGQSGVVQV